MEQDPQQDATQRKHPVFEVLSRWLDAFWSYLPLFFGFLTCRITCRQMYYYLFRPAQSDIERGVLLSAQAAQNPDNPTVNDPIALENWRNILRKMGLGWTLIAGGSVLFLGLALALLQLSAVFDQIYLRMAAIFVFSLSLASGVCACVFLAMESELGSSDKANRWVQASMDLTSLASLDFWLCLAWPLTSLTWAIIICITTVFALACIDQNPNSGPDPPPFPSASKIDIAIITVITTTLAIFVFGHFYRVFKFVPWSDVST